MRELRYSYLTQTYDIGFSTFWRKNESSKSPQYDSEPTSASDFDGDSITKTGRIGANPERYEGKDLRVEPHSIEVQQWDLKLEELEEELEEDEPPCPIGFIQKESIATEFCSDVDEVKYASEFIRLTSFKVY